ncbi:MULTISPECIES: MarR family winged helix-turn-helix transcriptional regulator [Olivibacter]|uniref:MarR family winged helix-turn-helix transcriptional regulator n=1 Tax=Olivibacter oleidegradans TaxID=760123 RepID=A0ABV6HMJ8_9SPHI|nr:MULTISPECIES: MarR family transcriptional regulator [Olivibacter]MDX3915485.1 MarR family transcriptional regulator [Pseudosphingobacterium sp.]
MNKGDFNGVTATHYNLVEYIYRKGKTTGKKLTMDFGISAPAISRQVKFLLENDLLSQEQSDEDRRVFYLKATDKGKLLIDASESFREHVTKQASVILSKKELEDLAYLLNKVLTKIKL